VGDIPARYQKLSERAETDIVPFSDPRPTRSFRREKRASPGANLSFYRARPPSVPLLRAPCPGPNNFVIPVFIPISAAWM